MIVVYPFSLKDQDQALRNAQWILALEGKDGLSKHDVLILKDHRVDEIIAKQIWEALFSVFGKWEILDITTDAWDQWPESCNHMFGQAARHIERQPDRGPWLWLEPDAIPLRKGWLDILEAEYKAAGKPFMGDLVNVTDVPIHMSGVGIYPPSVGEHAREAVIAHEIAWDVQAANDIVPRMYETKLIEHAWRHPTFPDWDSVIREVDLANAVLFHSSKDGSLIERLRERRVEESGRPHLAHNQKIAGSNPAPATIQSESAVRMAAKGGEPDAKSESQSSDSAGETPTTASNLGGKALESLSGPAVGGNSIPAGRSQILCDIFIKTYPPDYEWLRYCLRSINRFADGFRYVVLTYEGDSPSLDISSELSGYQRHRNVGSQPDGYLWQQVIKLDADKFTDAPYILYLDSDTIFTTPVTPENYFRDGKIIWMMTPWEKVSTPWQPVVEKFLKKPVAFEFMRRHPFIAPRWLLAELRAFCEREHGVPLDSYVMNQPHRSFSEFNVMGAFAYEFFRDEFVWVNTETTSPEDWPPLTVMQCWSRGGLTPEIKQKFEEVLSGGVPLNEIEPRPVVPPAQTILPAVPVLAKSDVGERMKPPLTSGEARESTPARANTGNAVQGQLTGESRGSGQTLSIDDAIARLAIEASRGWFYKKRLEKKLKEAGALPKWKRPRRK